MDNVELTEQLEELSEIEKRMKQIEDEYEKFDRDLIKQPTLKVDQIFKYLLTTLNKRIQAGKGASQTDMFFLIEARDTLTMMLYIGENPDIWDEVEKESQ